MDGLSSFAGPLPPLRHERRPVPPLVPTPRRRRYLIPRQPISHGVSANGSQSVHASVQKIPEQSCMDRNLPEGVRLHRRGGLAKATLKPLVVTPVSDFGAATGTTSYYRKASGLLADINTTDSDSPISPSALRGRIDMEDIAQAYKQDADEHKQLKFRDDSQWRRCAFFDAANPSYSLQQSNQAPVMKTLFA